MLGGCCASLMAIAWLLLRLLGRHREDLAVSKRARWLPHVPQLFLQERVVNFFHVHCSVSFGVFGLRGFGSFRAPGPVPKMIHIVSARTPKCANAREMRSALDAVGIFTPFSIRL